MSMNNPYNKLNQNNAYSKYTTGAVSTATKEELTLMLYEAALKFCNKAIVSLEAGNEDDLRENVERVQAIIEEFECTLDYKYEISKSLFSMYDYMFNRLIEAVNMKDMEILEEVRGLLREFRDTWKEAMKLAKQQVAHVE